MSRRRVQLLRGIPALAYGLGLASSCAQIIGISDYDIDPSLDPSRTGMSGEASGGVETSGGAEASGGTQPNEGGVSSGDAGQPGGLAGQSTGGVSAGDGGAVSDAGEPGVAGQAGAGPGPEPECESPLDCDDGIPCTVDGCNVVGRCSHSPNSSLCASGANECFACVVGSGCVARVFTETELLDDKDFDLLNGAWYESSTWWTYVIYPWEFADTPDNIAEFGPTPLEETEQELAYLSQIVLIPASTQKLTLTGVYQLTQGGTSLDVYDSVFASLVVGNTQGQVHIFNVWNGTDPERIFWQTFKFEATRAELTSVLGQQARLEFEGFAWDSVFDFDSLSLKATSCPAN